MENSKLIYEPPDYLKIFLDMKTNEYSEEERKMLDELIEQFSTRFKEFDTVSGEIEAIIDEKLVTRIRLKNSGRAYWMFGNLPHNSNIRPGKVVEIQFDNILIDSHKQAWIKSVQLFKNSVTEKESKQKIY